MAIIFMNSENNKTSSPHCLVLNLTDKMDLKKRGCTRCAIQFEHL